MFSVSIVGGSGVEGVLGLWVRVIVVVMSSCGWVFGDMFVLRRWCVVVLVVAYSVVKGLVH